MKEYLRHRFNPLHVYCRLCDAGVTRHRAKRLSSFYERVYVMFL